MIGIFGQFGQYITRLMSGGTFEIILLIVLVVVALILFLVALWILWKLLVLLGKGLVWLFRKGGETFQGQSAARREARLAAPPPVATGWGSSPRIRLRRALAEARRMVGPDALRIVVLAGDGFSDLCRGLGLQPPGVGTIGIAAGRDTILVDASGADSRTLRKLANALPWRRPLDAAAVLVEPGGIPSEALVRAANFARHIGMRVALHFVLPSPSRLAVWRIVDQHNRDGNEICTQLAADTTRAWLTEGSREGLKELAEVQTRDLPAAINRALASVPVSVVDIASLSFSGAGLRSASAQTTDRTHPATAPGLRMLAAAVVLFVGVILAGLTVVTGVERAQTLRSTVDTATREARVSWTAQDIDTIPSGARVRRIAGLGTRLAEYSDFSGLIPLAGFVPDYDAPGALGAALIDGYVLRPLADALDRKGQRLLTPSDDPGAWLENARLVGEWIAAWEGLREDPEEVDVRKLFIDAFGGDKSAWSEGTDIALIRTGVELPSAIEGGLDTEALIELARSNFVTTMQRWADKVYTNGPVASAARRVSERSFNWRAQHEALSALREALQDPGQQWVTSAEDRPDYGFELRILGRAIGLSLLGEGAALEAKAEVSRIRIDAREAVEYFVLPEIGPLMVRPIEGAQGGGGGASLGLSPEAQAWLAFLDRIANAGFLHLSTETPLPIAGDVTVDPTAIAEASRQIRSFDRFAMDLPQGLSPVIAQDLIRDLASELVISVAAAVERALRSDNVAASEAEHTQRLSRVAPALEEMGEIEGWLRGRSALAEAERVGDARARVAENILASGEVVLEREDPVGVHLDPAADSEALVRRFERGVARLQRLYDRLGSPFIDAAAPAGGDVTLGWQDMANDIAAYKRGDIDSALSGLEGVVRAYAEDPAAACEAPRVPLAAGRDDYIARSLSRFRTQFDTFCKRRIFEATEAIYREFVDYFARDVTWLWPYASDPAAPEIPPSTLGEFVGRLDQVKEELAKVDAPFAQVMIDNANFWTRDEGGGVEVQFRVEWRARPSEEQFAENIVGVEFDGAERDESGTYTWRYGAPLAVRIRLARNSSYRFPSSSDAEGLERLITADGNGALLRIFTDLTGGVLTLRSDIVDGEGQRRTMVVTARVTHADGAPITMPRFAIQPPELPGARQAANRRG